MGRGFGEGCVSTSLLFLLFSLSLLVAGGGG